MILLLLSLLTPPTPASARVYDLYRTDRRFRGGFCTAIGGACAADTDIITGIFENPAALAPGGEPDWDFDGDYSSKSHLEPGMKESNDATETSGVVGVSYTTGRLGAGFAFARQVNSVQADLTVFDDLGLPKKTKVDSTGVLTQLRFPFALRLGERISLGLALSLTSHSQELSLANGANEPAKDSSKYTLGTTIGGLFQWSESLRLGSWFRLPNTLYESVNFTSYSLSTALVYSEDMALYNPWIWAFGSQFDVDERTSLYGEADVIGATEKGYLLSYDTFSAAVNDTALRPKGRQVVMEPHLGLRRRINEKLRLHGGTYYEASRWEGLPGRLHGTMGVSYFAFHFVDLIGGIDLAKNYAQLILTFR